MVERFFKLEFVFKIQQKKLFEKDFELDLKHKIGQVLLGQWSHGQNLHIVQHSFTTYWLTYIGFQFAKRQLSN